ncbi:DegT/DnrJ/EryC1/StrS aminotransferase family protein [Tateyamaria sp. syn59]|uniref:DegT/DnrJ/EryC1/StrS family aminotransferase n=1 Tax=Tateyamaria sp. syn59 TaxID=2576942 RepID=UPI0011BE4416|nr:DegT/DnrJ/EryC1/StrS family aminotransferase [Tateyamaria sp. syn59]
MAQIPFLDLRAAYLALQPDIDAAVQRVLASGWYIQGPEVEAFETAYATYCGAKHCVGVANGLDALILGLRALDIGPGDEVIVPSHTFVATWLAVSAVGATPIPVEPHAQTYNVDPALVPSAITARTRAIIAVHLYGQPADLDPLLEVAQKHDLVLVEDAAQAHGAMYKGRRIGAHGDVVCWSFYPGKNLGALGDGGAITTDRTDIADQVRVLGNYGSSKKYVNDEQGTNSRLDPVQAAALAVKLEHLDAWTARRREIAGKYSSALQGVTTPFVPNWADPVWHLYVVQHPKRDALMAKLSEEGISTLIHYPIAPHRQKAYAGLGYAAGAFPLAEVLADNMLSLPIGPQMPDADVDRVIETVNRVAPTL